MVTSLLPRPVPPEPPAADLEPSMDKRRWANRRRKGVGRLEREKKAELQEGQRTRVQQTARTRVNETERKADPTEKAHVKIYSPGPAWSTCRFAKGSWGYRVNHSLTM